MDEKLKILRSPDYKEKSITSLLLLVFSLCFCQAQNHVTIASIGGEGPVLKANLAPQVAVNNMIDYWNERIEEVLPFRPDLIVLPEVFDRPSKYLSSEMKITYYEVRKNQVRDYLASVAKTNNCYIAFGTRREDTKGNLRNSCIILDRSGKTVGIYDKNFPTIREMEEGIVAGTEVPIIETDFGRVAAAICFDLNFMELLDKYAQEKPDIILFPSMYHGGLEQGNWAYSSRSFFVSSLGPNELISEIRNPLGEVIASSTNYFHYVVATINLDAELAHLDGNWQKLRALKEKYGEFVTISDPGKLGAVLISSEKKDISANQMIREFDIELLDDYFNRSRNYRLRQIKD
ncbi:carbon-nitrogen hydrolase family protein [Arenibacter sp. S6351L]|uniref:carbon-nitrogen hydrolase family protein n=1 Tax=Arenibacter sp. S6351L TaxID=2926407 RepID=UPI001FF4BD42|nr:carbon-nitrogen hydrolase family protein [Arenibacter sp. S6351L]MCK0136063.1 carbon-nitrogen hydrolase family protein [Arenibacter sp. S6351L]